MAGDGAGDGDRGCPVETRVTGSGEAAKTAEALRAACEARWLALQLATLLAKHQVPVPRRLRGPLDRVRQAQMQHRRADRRACLDAIDADIRQVSDDMAEIRRRGGIVTEALVERRDRLREERRATAALSDDVLLRDYWGAEGALRR